MITTISNFAINFQMAGQWSRDINLVLIFLKQFFGSFQDKQKCKKMSNMRDPKQQEVNTRLQNPNSETSSRYSGPLAGILSKDWQKQTETN